MGDEALHGGVRLHRKGTAVESDHSRVLPHHLPRGQPAETGLTRLCTGRGAEHTGCPAGRGQDQGTRPQTG